MSWAHIMHGTMTRLLTKRLSIGALILSPWQNVIVDYTNFIVHFSHSPIIIIIIIIILGGT